jgi:hypothetical protein
VIAVAAAEAAATCAGPRQGQLRQRASAKAIEASIAAESAIASNSDMTAPPCGDAATVIPLRRGRRVAKGQA